MNRGGELHAHDSVQDVLHPSRTITAQFTIALLCGKVGIRARRRSPQRVLVHCADVVGGGGGET